VKFIKGKKQNHDKKIGKKKFGKKLKQTYGETSKKNWSKTSVEKRFGKQNVRTNLEEKIPGTKIQKQKCGSKNLRSN
jgi:hypothetical protein